MEEVRRLAKHIPGTKAFWTGHQTGVFREQQRAQGNGNRDKVILAPRVIARALAFITREMGSYWRVLSRAVK